MSTRGLFPNGPPTSDARGSWTQSLSTVFLVAVPIAAVAFILFWLLPEVRLRTTTQATDVGHTFAMPTARSSQEEIERALYVLESRDSLDQIYRRFAARAGVDLDPLSSWLLFRLQEQAPISKRAWRSDSMCKPTG